MNATAKDLRFHSKELLETVARGEEVVISFHGKPCAKLVPLKPEQKKVKGHSPAFGMWKDHIGTADVGAYVRKLREGRY